MDTENKPDNLWPGGYWRLNKRGKKVFIISRMIGTQRFHVSTRAHNLTAAMKQFERFEADPANYRPEGRKAEKVTLSPELIQEHFTHSLASGNTAHYAKGTLAFLTDWRDDLGDIDLRHVTLRDHVKPALDERETSRRQRIIALKSFYAWLRKDRHMLTSANDPTLDLPVPQGSPEKHRRRKAVAFDVVCKVFKHLAPAYRDVLQLLAATGWHVSEVTRFVRREDSAIITPEREVMDHRGRKVLAVLVTWHKTKKFTRTPLVEPEHVRAAERLRERRTMPRKLRETFRAACELAGVPKFNPGVMRHSVGTWAVELGATKEQVAEYLDHADKSTTERFYIDVHIPTTTVPTRVLG
jgi:integrase